MPQQLSSTPCEQAVNRLFIVHESLYCHLCFLFKDKKNLTLIQKIEASVKCSGIYLTLLPVKLELGF